MYHRLGIRLLRPRRPVGVRSSRRAHALPRARRPFIWKCSGRVHARVRNISISPADLRSLVRFPVALKSGLDLAPRFLDSLVPLSLAQDFFSPNSSTEFLSNYGRIAIAPPELYTRQGVTALE